MTEQMMSYSVTQSTLKIKPLTVWDRDMYHGHPKVWSVFSVLSYFTTITGHLLLRALFVPTWFIMYYPKVFIVANIQQILWKKYFHHSLFSQKQRHSLLPEKFNHISSLWCRVSNNHINLLPIFLVKHYQILEIALNSKS